MKPNCSGALQGRSYSLEIRAADGTDDRPSTLYGRAVPFNKELQVGYYFEIFSPRTFAKSIRESARELPLMLNHDNAILPIGKAMKWTPSDGGLDVEWALDRSDPLAMTAARKARDGFLNGLSVRFAPLQDRQGDRPSQAAFDPSDSRTFDRVHRVEARLLEVSLTPTPAFADAGVTEVRELGDLYSDRLYPNRSKALDWLAKVKS